MRTVDIGTIEFHSERFNPGLPARFHNVTESLRSNGCIVDLWLMDIQTVLKEFGYDMTITTDRESPIPCWKPQKDGELSRGTKLLVPLD